MEQFRGRPVGDLILRGKTEALRAFESLRAEQYADPATKSYLEAFAKLEAGDPGAMAAFAAHVGKHADDQLASFHLKRLLNGASARKSLWTSGQGAGDVGWAEVHRNRRRNRADVAGAGRGKSGSVSRAGAYSRASSAGKSWVLRAAMSVAAASWRDQGKPQQAREVLAPVYGCFAEGFDTRDLKEAKALLDALSPPPDAPLTSKDAT